MPLPTSSAEEILHLQYGLKDICDHKAHAVLKAMNMFRTLQKTGISCMYQLYKETYMTLKCMYLVV